MEKDLLIQTAIACVACDGTFDDRELDILRKYVSEKKLCEKDQLEQIITDFKGKFSKEGLDTLRSIINHLMAAGYDREETISILKTAHEIILADEKIEYLEIKFFKMLCKVLHVPQESLKEIIPNIEPIFHEEDIAVLSPIENYFQAAQLALESDHKEE